jgi:hypothetical protein
MPEPPSESEADVLRRLVRGVVLAQGNLFIKELLRRKRIKIGSTKADFETNLLRAIDDGQLTQDDVESWLNDVEGWGDQHVYLYRLTKEVMRDSFWRSNVELRRRLRTAGLEDLLNAPTSWAFPEERQLTGIYCNRESLRFVWHERQTAWIRTPERDREEELDGDRYQFRAHRERFDRSVMRLELRPEKRLAGVFLQIPWNQNAHESALAAVATATRPVFDFAKLRPFEIARAITRLDQTELDDQRPVESSRIIAQRTRLSDAAAYVEFASTADEGIYKDSEAVRHVRRALSPDRFTGTTGVFFYRPSAAGQQRQVKIELFGQQRRVRLWSQLTAKQVWDILQLLNL